MIRNLLRALAWLTAVMVIGCGTEPTLCTSELRAITIVVRTADGSPVPGLTILDTVLRTGEGFEVPQGGGGAPQQLHRIFDDSFLPRIRPTGDSVRVTGVEGATPRFAADFAFDAPGGCHVRKVAGPDTVTIP